MVKLRKSKKKGLELVRQMQYTIDEYERFVEHLFLLLKKDPNRQMLVGGAPMEWMMNDIARMLDELLIQAGRK